MTKHFVYHYSLHISVSHKCIVLSIINTSKPFCVSNFNKDHFLVMKSSLFICFIFPFAIAAISPVRLPDLVDDLARNKGLEPLPELVWTNETLLYERYAFYNIVLEKTVSYYLNTNMFILMYLLFTYIYYYHLKNVFLVSIILV